MKIYCSHLNKAYTKTSDYYQCHVCLASWYGKDLTPMIILGFTDVTEVDPKYFDKLEAKELSNKKFIRCLICKDVIEKRKHYLCSVKAFFSRFFV